MPRYINPFPQYLNVSGSPISGGFLKFFETGTSTTKDVYSDSALTQSIGSEIRLSASGRVPTIYLNGAYDVKLTDASSNELDEAIAIGIDSDIMNFDLWLNTTTYNIPDIVKGTDDLYYQSIVDTNLGNTPGAGSAFWEQIYFLPTWNTAQTYAAGQLAIGSDGRTYSSQVGSNTGNNPTLDDGTNWLSPYQAGDDLEVGDVTIQKLEAASAYLGFENAGFDRWQVLFDTDETLKINRHDGSGVLIDTLMEFDINSAAIAMTAAVTITGDTVFNGDLTTNDGDVVFSRVGDAVDQDVFLTSDTGEANTLYFQDDTVSRWQLGQTTDNDFLLKSYSAGGADPQDIIKVASGTIDIILRGDIEFNSATSGIHGTSTSGGALNFNFTALSLNTEDVSVDFFDATTTTGDRFLDVYLGDGTSTVTCQIDASDGSIHPAYDRRGESDAGVKLNKIVLSTDAPSGGEDGDLWLRY